MRSSGVGSVRVRLWLRPVKWRDGDVVEGGRLGGAMPSRSRWEGQEGLYQTSSRARSNGRWSNTGSGTA